jgi:hypothetical protein
MMIDIKEDMEDSIVESVRQDLLDRSKAGIKKYHNTLDREDLDLVDWIQHAYEEMLDGALYLKRAKRDIEEMNSCWDDLVKDYINLKNEFELKERVIETLNKVIYSQEQEIKELKNEKYLQEKRRAWHY